MNLIYYHTLPDIKGYFRPQTLAEALSLLSEYSPQTRLLAGGTDLIVLMRSRKLTPRYLADIKGIRGWLTSR